MTNGLLHPYHLDESTFIIGESGNVFHNYFIFMIFFNAKRIAIVGSPCFATSHLGLFFCLCHIKRTAGLYGLITIFDLYTLRKKFSIF